MTAAFPDLNAVWADLIIEELIRRKADHFFLSPGSRSSPLTIAVARNERAHSIVHYDERGSAFAALGFARAAHRPAVVITTSGTAVANLMPAAVEASMDMVPLILLTADRPPELRASGANQTIDQVKIFGDHVRWFVDVPCPDEVIDPRWLLTAVDQAVHYAVRSPAGPVHLNCMLREPLAPLGPNRDFSNYLAGLGDWRESRDPLTRYDSGTAAAATETVSEAAQVLRAARRPLIVVGRLPHRHQSEAVLALVRRCQWPVFADVTSGLRLGTRNSGIIAYYDQLLLVTDLAEGLLPDLVLHIGGVPTSKRLLRFLELACPAQYVMVQDHPRKHDPVSRVTLCLETDIADFCEQLGRRVGRLHCAADWRENLVSASRAVETVFREMLDNGSDLTQPAVARLISQHIQPHHGLFLASSLPIREVDMYADPQGAAIVVACNRGASGIDGTIATAAGFTLGLARPATLLIGDLAFLHDLNSLALLRQIEHPITMVLLNNDGGGVFSFLPVAKCEDIFERYFATPHGLTFNAVAEMFDIEYHRPDSKQAFLSAFRQSQQTDRSVIIEVQTDRRENARFQQKLQEKVIAVLRER